MHAVAPPAREAHLHPRATPSALQSRHVNTLLAFIGVVAILVFGWRLTVPAWLDDAIRALESPWAPVAVGLASSAIIAWVWCSLPPIPTVHDEAAYVLQARIYAAFHWTAPGRPLPEFFEQYHVFVTPRLFAKYWPGHSLALVPGIWLGMPALVPILCVGVTSAALFSLARRIANPLVALVAALLWITAPGVLHLDTYLSESTSGALWVLGWLALLQWYRTGARRWLLCLALCVGWGAMTRPYTWLLYALPVGGVVLPRIVSHRAWSDLAWSGAVITAFLCILVLWCLHTTGQPFLSPYTLYTKTYLPNDVLGFGYAGHTPLRPLNADMQHFAEWTHGIHAPHVLSALPHELVQRVTAIGRGMWPSYRAALLPFLVFALVPITAEVWFGLASCVLLVLGYLMYAHSPDWTSYYFEILPALAIATALGLWRFGSLVGGAQERRRRTGPRTALVSATAAMVLIVLALLPSSIQNVSEAQSDTVIRTMYHRRFRDAMANLPGDKLIVFVRYAPRHSPHKSLISNDPDLIRARVWTVYDRGPDDIRLLRLAPNRVPYLYDEAQRAFTKLDTTEMARVASLSTDDTRPAPTATMGNALPYASTPTDFRGKQR